MAQNFVRENPTRAPAAVFEKSPGAMPQIGGVKHVADMMQGSEFSHLGHFQNAANLKAGHNTVKGGAHPGFKAVQNKIARSEGVGGERAGAILAAATRRASAGAKRRNPRLRRVKG